MVVVAVAALLASSASAGLIKYEMKALSGSTGVTVSADGKTVGVTAANQTVTLALYAMVYSGNGSFSDDGLLYSCGGVMSGASGTFARLKGDLGGVTNLAPMNTTPYAKPGLVSDVDGDGDLDIGGNSAATNLTDAFIASPGTTVTYTGNVGTDGNWKVWKLAEMTFTVGTLGATAQETLVQFTARKSSSINGNSVKFTTDGATTSWLGTNAGIEYGAPVLIQVPEPVTMSLLALGGLLLSRKRRVA